jgi:hypothetical protein
MARAAINALLITASDKRIVNVHIPKGKPKEAARAVRLRMMPLFAALPGLPGPCREIKKSRKCSFRLRL